MIITTVIPNSTAVTKNPTLLVLQSQATTVDVGWNTSNYGIVSMCKLTSVNLLMK